MNIIKGVGLFILIAVMCLLCACGQKSSWRKGGTPGTKPYTVLGKTYYPLKSAHGFMEEGIASWYGPGFHGKSTASGEKYNQYEMTAAHKILPLGTNVRVTHLGNGKSIIVRVNDRGPFVGDRIIDLSREAANRLALVGSGTARVRVQSLGDVPQITSAGNVKGDFYIQAGAFAKKENALKLIENLVKSGHKGRLYFGNNNMWNVQIGPWPDSEAAKNRLSLLKELFPNSFMVGGS